MGQPLRPGLINFNRQAGAIAWHPQLGTRCRFVLRLWVPRSQAQVLDAPIWLNQPSTLCAVVGPACRQIIAAQGARLVANIASASQLVKQANGLRALGQTQGIARQHQGVTLRTGQQPWGVSGSQSDPPSGCQ